MAVVNAHQTVTTLSGCSGVSSQAAAEQHGMFTSRLLALQWSLLSSMVKPSVIASLPPSTHYVALGCHVSAAPPVPAYTG